MTADLRIKATVTKFREWLEFYTSDLHRVNPPAAADVVQELKRTVSETGQQDNDMAEASKFAHHKYDTAKLREMIKKAFNDDGFTEFCFDHFRITYEKFSTGMTRLQKIQLLIEDCDRREKLDELLRLLK